MHRQLDNNTMADFPFDRWPSLFAFRKSYYDLLDLSPSSFFGYCYVLLTYERRCQSDSQVERGTRRSIRSATLDMLKQVSFTVKSTRNMHHPFRILKTAIQPSFQLLSSCALIFNIASSSATPKSQRPVGGSLFNLDPRSFFFEDRICLVRLGLTYTRTHAVQCGLGWVQPGRAWHDRIKGRVRLY